jgi:hypothetical protein
MWVLLWNTKVIAGFDTEEQAIAKRKEYNRLYQTNEYQVEYRTNLFGN